MTDDTTQPAAGDPICGGRATALRTAVVAAAIALGGLALPATAHAAVTCLPIDAVGVGQASADGATTTATIRGGGPLTGTTAGAFRATGVSGTVVSIAGTVVFTPQYGKGDPPTSRLNTEFSGTFDVASGAFQARTGAVSGTGKLAGATGSLTLAGVQDATGRFTETVTGTLCVDRSR